MANLAALLKRGKVAVDVCGLSGLDALLFVSGVTEVGTQAVNTILVQVAGKFVESNKQAEQALGLYMQTHLEDLAWSHAEQAKLRICDGDFACLLNGSTNSDLATVLPDVKAAAAAPQVKLM